MTITRSSRRTALAALVVVTAMIVALGGTGRGPGGSPAGASSADAGESPATATVDTTVASEVAGGGGANVIVRFETDEQAVRAVDGELTPGGDKLTSAAPLVATTVDANDLDDLRRAPGVVSVTEDREHTVDLAQSVEAIQASGAWSDGFTGAGARVAILDTGILKSHPFFEGRVVAEACFSGDPGSSNDGLCPGPDPHQAVGPGTAQPCDDHALAEGARICWHGTHVAGIVAGHGGPTDAPSGVAPGADLIAVQVMSRTNSGSMSALDSDLIEAMAWVATQQNRTEPIVAVNMSLGGEGAVGYCDSRPADALVKTQIDALAQVDIAVVASAGNSYSKTKVSSPGCISSAIAVGATDNARNVRSFSASGAALDLLAPGLAITSSRFTYSGSTPVAGYGPVDGTSMAAPHVAGALAVLAEARGVLPVSSMVEALTRSGIPTVDPGNGLSRPFIQVADAVDVELRPVGRLESATAGAGAARMIGWAFDPDTTDAATIEVRVGGMPWTQSPADASRPDVDAIPAPFGTLHGIDVTASGLSTGRHSVCIAVLDTTTQVRVSLGCSNVTVTSGPAAGPSPYTDVKSGDQFYESIAWLGSSGITTGYDDGRYRPLSPMSRQAVAAFLYRLEGSPSFTAPATPTFTDVPVGAPFRKEIEWAASHGITTGYEDGSFRPVEDVSRQAFAAFLFRFDGEPASALPPAPTFRDVGATHTFHRAIEWMASSGIADGNADGTFGTETLISRQALAAFLARYANPAT